MTRTYRFYVVMALFAAAARMSAAEQAMEFAQSQPTLAEAHPNALHPLDQFQSAFERDADVTFADQFQTLEVAWQKIAADNSAPDLFTTQSVGAAAHALSRSVVYGLHQATMNLPVVAWLEGDRGFLASFLRNSVESVEADAGMSQEVPVHFSAQSWWSQQLQTGALAYGIRPFRTDPYAFLSWGLRQGSDLLLATHVRYYCRNLVDHKFEFCLSVPFARQFSFDFGASYQFGRHEDEQKVSLRLLRALPGGSLLHVGLDFRWRPEVFAGVSFPI